MTEETKFFAEEIKKCRTSLGENQTQFAKRFRVATNSISRYETGLYQAPYEILLWVLLENRTINDTSPASLDHANLAIKHLQKTITALNKEKQDERQAVIKEIDAYVKGMMSLYEHMGFKGKVVCEACGEVVEAGSPCENSKYYEEWKRLAELRAKLVEMKEKTI